MLNIGTTSSDCPRTGVTIFDEPERIEPVKIFADDDASGTSLSLAASYSPKLHRASISGKKLTGRPALPHTNSSTSVANFSLDNSNNNNPESVSVGTPAESKTPDLRGTLSQVVEWLHEEKTKRQKQRHHRDHQGQHHHHHTKTPGNLSDESASMAHDSSIDNAPDLSLEKLENILSSFVASSSFQALPKLGLKSSSSFLRKGSIAKKYKPQHRASVPVSSDTEFFGDDILVPSVEAYLDNSKTMAFTGGSADVDTSESAKRRDYEHWITFKKDIVRLTHTLKLKGWRRISMDRASEIDVARLSGALTNAVYVVHPPKNMSDSDHVNSSTDHSATSTPASKRRPLSLLLRIYGPQVEHLIDRDYELSILRRLARKRIGPRLLGSFENGRFEEFLHAKTLTAEDIRIPETSKQIAKRMRELHEGIELLESELAAGPAVFINWDKWVDRVEKVITWLDAQVHLAEEEAKSGTSRRTSTVNPRYIRRGLICGVEWPVFRKTYEAYRKRLLSDCGGMNGIRKTLVFAHNDTQYGNLMRLQPSGTSPLIQPSNQHKQLVVIDFEYASQNTVGLEFANHFTEWCYNYHHAEKSFACDTRRYPDENEQYRFVRSYVMHRPQFNAAASATPKMEGREKTNISDFMLDARAPPASAGGGTGAGVWELDYDKEEQEREKAQEEEIQKLLAQTRVWRLANSAMWVAWGIVQAKVPELDDLEQKDRKKSIAEKMGGKVVEKVRQMVGVDKDGEADEKKDKENGKWKPMSDALKEEDRMIQEQSRWDRPEGRAQEEAHREGNVDQVAVVESDKKMIAPNANPYPNSTASANEDESVNGGPEKEDQSAFPCQGEEEPQDEGFDYLAYAQERAMFFWGDCVQMGLVNEDELPEGLRGRVKTVPY